MASISSYRIRIWESYEQVATELLNHFADKLGLDCVEGKQTIKGKKTGTNWEIDAKGICAGGEEFMIIECRRRTTSKLNQEQIGALAYRVIDTGAAGAIIISPCGIQSGAAKIAAAEKIHVVELDAGSTPTDFALKLLGKMMLGSRIELKSNLGIGFSEDLYRTCDTCGGRFCVEENEKLCRDCKAIES